MLPSTEVTLLRQVWAGVAEVVKEVAPLLDVKALDQPLQNILKTHQYNEAVRAHNARVASLQAQEVPMQSSRYAYQPEVRHPSFPEGRRRSSSWRPGEEGSQRSDLEEAERAYEAAKRRVAKERSNARSDTGDSYDGRSNPRRSSQRSAAATPPQRIGRHPSAPGQGTSADEDLRAHFRRMLATENALDISRARNKELEAQLETASSGGPSAYRLETASSAGGAAAYRLEQPTDHPFARARRASMEGSGLLPTPNIWEDAELQALRHDVHALRRDVRRLQDRVSQMASTPPLPPLSGTPRGRAGGTSQRLVPSNGEVTLRHVVHDLQAVADALPDIPEGAETHGDDESAAAVEVMRNALQTLKATSRTIRSLSQTTQSSPPGNTTSQSTSLRTGSSEAMRTAIDGFRATQAQLEQLPHPAPLRLPKVPPSAFAEETPEPSDGG